MEMKAENFLGTTSTQHQIAGEFLGILNAMFPVLSLGRWWVSAFGAPSIREGEGDTREERMVARRKKVNIGTMAGQLSQKVKKNGVTIEWKPSLEY